MATAKKIAAKVAQDIELPKEVTRRVGNFRVSLSNAGNPDRGQDPTRPLWGVRPKSAIAQTMEVAAAICQNYIQENDLGSGNWTGGEILEDGRLVAKVSYNGRIWNADPDYVPAPVEADISLAAAATTPVQNVPRVVFHDDRGTHVIFDAPVNRLNFNESCQMAVDMAKAMCGQKRSVAVNFYALGVDVQVTERSNVETAYGAWVSSLEHRMMHTPFLSVKDGQSVISSNESGAVLKSNWIGVCCDGKDANKYWYIGSAFGERSYSALKARDYTSACIEAEPLRNMELFEVGPLPRGWQPEVGRAKERADGQFSLGSGQIDHIMRLASLMALRRAGDHAVLKGKGAASSTERAQQELRSYLEGLSLSPAPLAQQAPVDKTAVASLNLDMLDMVIDNAMAHVDDIAEGLEDGTYEASENTNFPEKKAALAHVQAWHASASRVQKIDVGVAAVPTADKASSLHSFQPSIDVLANYHVNGVDLESLRSQAAETVFQNYDLGEGVETVDSSGWERVTPGDEWTRSWFVETYDGAGGAVAESSTSLTMVVRFEPGSHRVSDAYARDNKGNDWGHLPVTPEAQFQPNAVTNALTNTPARKEQAKQVANDGPSI